MKKLLFALLASGLIMSCGDDDSEGTPATATLDLNISGLEDLGSTAQYEGWVLLSDGPKSTGTFTVDANGALSATSFTVDAADLAAATKFILTVEPIPDPDPAPSAWKLIAGDFSGTSASLSTSTAPAVGDFSAAAGKLFLRTPTDETEGNNGNDENGVWFGVPGMPPTNGFTLPTLADGWKYEGWVVANGTPISTGTFTDFGAADASSTFSGTAAAGPPVPGEDFFMNAPEGVTFPLDIRGKTVVISVEPDPDFSAAPFLLKPLTVMLDANALTVGEGDNAPNTHDFNQNLGSLPTGTVTR